MRKKQLLATLVMLSLMQGSVYAADLGEITSDVTLVENSNATIVKSPQDNNMTISGEHTLYVTTGPDKGPDGAVSQGSKSQLDIEGSLNISNVYKGITSGTNAVLTVGGKTVISDVVYAAIEAISSGSELNFNGGLEVNNTNQSLISLVKLGRVTLNSSFININGHSTSANSAVGAIEANNKANINVIRNETTGDSGLINIKNINYTNENSTNEKSGIFLSGANIKANTVTINEIDNKGTGLTVGIYSIDPSYKLNIDDVFVEGITGNGSVAGFHSQSANYSGLTENYANNFTAKNIKTLADNAQAFGYYDEGYGKLSVLGTMNVEDISAEKGMAYGVAFFWTEGEINNFVAKNIKGADEVIGLMLYASGLDINNVEISNLSSTSNDGIVVGIDAIGTAVSPYLQHADVRLYDGTLKYHGNFIDSADNLNDNIHQLAIRSTMGANISATEGKNNIIVGNVLAGRGTADKDAPAGKIELGGENLKVYGDVYAGNGGVININLNGDNAILEGQVDDYHELNSVKKDTVFKNSNFTAVDGSELDVETAGTITLNIDNSATWIARGQSFVDTISLDGGIIDMSQNDNSSVTVDTLSSKNGVLKMKLNTNDRTQSDMLYVTGSMSGNYQLIIDETNFDASKTEIDPLRFATVKGDVDISGINARSVDVGFFDTDYKIFTEDFIVGDEDNKVYNNSGVEGNDDHAADYKPGNGFVETTFNNDDTNLMIGGIEKQTVSDAGQTIINMSRANYSNAIYMDRLNKRMGEARYISPEDEQGMWVRLRHDRIGKEEAFRSQNTMYEMGYDVKQDCDNGDRRVGFAIDYMDGKTEYRNVAGDGDIKRYGLWLYDTWMGDKGHYADYVLKWGHLENDFDIYNSRGKVNGDYSNNVFSVSAEYGKKNDMGNDWYFEPQAQLQLARVTGADYVTSQNTKVSLDGINSLIGRAGFRLGKDMGERSTVYVKADVLHEFLGDQTISALDTTTNGTYRETFENKGTWYDVGFGFATALSNNSYAFMDFEKSFGNDNDETYQINAGVQWTF